MQSTEYFLRDHVFFCMTDMFSLFLDLKADQYLCVEKIDFESLAPNLHGWPTSTTFGAVGGSSLTPAGRLLADELISRRMLSRDAIRFRKADPTSWNLPTVSLVSRGGWASMFQSPVRIASFLIAAARASRRLRTQSLYVTVREIKELRAARHGARASAGQDRAALLTNAFRALRPIFQRDHLCLFDSLALLEFLALYDIFPTWVFGVRPEPFAAHCWVQSDNVVLNDTVERTSGFIPIMTV
jgi:hypothetical protein